MEVISAKDPVWANTEHNEIYITVNFKDIGEVPFCASLNDVEPHGKDIFNRAVNGEFGIVLDAPVPVIDLETEQNVMINLVNNTRNTKETEGFSYLGKIFDSDSLSVQRITNSALSAMIAISNNTDFSITWTLKDNSSLNLSALRMLGCQAALTNRAAALHSYAKSLKELISAAESINDLISINIVDSWPVISES